MAANQHDLLIVYTSKNGRTGAMVKPIRQGMEDAPMPASRCRRLKRSNGRKCCQPRES